MLGEEEYIQDGKYRNYVAAMEKTLKNFEYSSDWPDLISALTKLNKVIQSYCPKYKIIPKRLLLVKRLSQCLHPSLPAGLHLKALETYDLVFKSIGLEKLRGELFIYATGLFPLANYAGLNVIPALLKIYETYLLPLGQDLIPCLDGFLQGLLLGMEETADNHRQSALLDSVREAVSPPIFYPALWKCTRSVPKLRLASITYLLSTRNGDDVCGNNVDLVQSAIISCLSDTNILVQRLCLELLSTREILGKEIVLVKAALRTLLRRDTSLNRRLVSWLNGCDNLLIEAIQSLLCDNDEDNYKIIVFLFDKQGKNNDTVLRNILIDTFRSMYIHNIPRSVGNIFFSTLNSHYIWNYLFTLVTDNLLCHESASVQKPGSGTTPLSEICLLICYILQNNYLEVDELPGFNQTLLEELYNKLEDIPLNNLISVINVCKSLSLSHVFSSVSKIFTKFITCVFMKIDISEVYENLCFPKLSSEYLYENECFEKALRTSIQQMSAKCKCSLPYIHVEADRSELEAFKNLCDLLLKSIQHDDAQCPSNYSSIFSALVISCVVKPKEVSLVAIQALTALLNNNECISILESTPVVEHIASFLWNESEFTSLHPYISSFPERIENFLMAKTDESFEDFTKKVKKLPLESVPFNKLVCKILDSLFSDDEEIRFHAENFVLGYSSSFNVILNPLIQIIKYQLKLTSSVLSGDCRNIAEQEGNKTEITDTSVSTDVDSSQVSRIERPSSLSMDSTGRFMPIIITTDCSSNNDKKDFSDIDEDNYLGLLDQQTPLQTSVFNNSDINHNDTKSLKNEDSAASEIIEGERSITTVSTVTLQSENCISVHQNTSFGEISATHNRLFSIHPYTTKMLLYIVPADYSQILYALKLIRKVLEIDVQSFITSVCSTCEPESGNSYLEVLLDTVLKTLEAFSLEQELLLISIHVEALRIIETLVKGFSINNFKEVLGSTLLKLQLTKSVLFKILTIPPLLIEEKLTSTEEIIRMNYNHLPLIYRKVMKVTTALISIEPELKHFRGSKHKVTNSFSPNVQIIRHSVFLDSLRQILSDDRLAVFHFVVLDLITDSLKILKNERVLVDVVKLLIGILGGESKGKDYSYIESLIDYLSKILHYVALEETVAKEKVHASPGLLSNLVSVFVGNSPATTTPTGSEKDDETIKSLMLSLLPSLLNSLVGIYATHRQTLNTLLNPIAIVHSTHFVHSLARIPPAFGAELVVGTGVLSVDFLLTTIEAYLKSIASNGVVSSGSPVNSNEDSAFSLSISLLSFFSHYLDKIQNVGEISSQLISLIKNTLTLPVLVQLHGLLIFHKLVKATFNGKDSNKELQDLGGKLLESVCGSSTEKRLKSELASTKVLEFLELYLTSLMDMVWPINDEKLPISTIVSFLTSYLKTKYPLQNYVHSSSIIAKISVYPSLRKSWKKDIFELILESNFFHFPQQCLPHWMTICDNLFSDKTSFGEFLARVSVPQTGSLNIFSTKEMEYELRGMLLKRLAFVIYSSPKDQYIKFLTLIQERLAEAIKVSQMIPIIQSQVFLVFRVLLLRLSPQHLSSLWPIILHEVLQALIHLETDILTQQPSHLYMYLQLIKLLQVALNLSSLPQFQSSNVFQMYHWTFVGPASATYTPHLTRITSLISSTSGIDSLPNCEQTSLRKLTKISNVSDLCPFLSSMITDRISVEELETGLEVDFLE